MKMFWQAVASYPPPEPDHLGRMRHFTRDAIAALGALLDTVYHKGETEARLVLHGALTLPAAVAQVGKTRGGARIVVLRATVCLRRLEEVYCFTCPVSARPWTSARFDLQQLQTAARRWSEQARRVMATKGHIDHKGGRD